MNGSGRREATSSPRLERPAPLWRACAMVTGDLSMTIDRRSSRPLTILDASAHARLAFHVNDEAITGFPGLASPVRAGRFGVLPRVYEGLPHN